MKAIIRIDVPDYQIGQEVSCYFKDTMMIKGIVQEPSGDLISRQASIEAVKQAIYNHDSAIMRLTELPPVNPQEPKYCDRNICVSNEYNGIGCDECEVTKSQEPKTGHWIYTEYHTWCCSECGGNPHKGTGFVPNKDGMKMRWKYCNLCGARMVEPQESEEISERNMKMWEELFKAERSDKE